MPSLSLQKTEVVGANAFILENELVRSVLVPGFGARVLSLIYKPTETEFAWHSPNVSAEPSGELENVSGFFDCIPTCDPCTLNGKSLPGFGEVSSKPWKVSKAERTPGTVKVSMEARCKIYPLLVRKEISLTKNRPVLVIRYEVHNMSDESLAYHYSGHNTLQVSPHHRIVLPREVTKLKLGYTGRLGRMGDHVTWPIAADEKGNQLDISRIGGPCDGTMENLYTPRLNQRWGAVVNEARMEAIGFAWEGDALRYVNVCTNNGGWKDYYFAALEPVTGRPDNLEVAVNQWKDYAVLKPDERTTWTQRIILAHNIRRVERIENDEFVQ
ncbi:MAG TPA: hypothetical protein VEJ19_04455 [Nitrososphaerales archaeon]|nr:hypothetical protein [Nitrososphaerales archaeon]